MRIKWLFILILLPGELILAQDKTAPLSPPIKTEVVNNLSSVLIRNYIFWDTAVRMSGRIKERLKDGTYSTANNPGNFAKMLSADLRGVYNDVHLSVIFNPSMAEQMHDNSYVQKITHQMDLSKQARQQNFGLSKVEVMSGNIGYVALNAFFEVDEQSKQAVNSAFLFLKNTDALIIDLRLNGGGAANMVKYICGYFFKKKTHINDVYERRANRIYQYWTEPAADSAAFYTMPVYVLVNGYTVSAAEELAYDLQCLHRASIVGQTTGGGAHPTQSMDIGHGFVANIPIARSINPVTKTNWEAVGVRPDININADSALDAAIFNFYDHEINTSKDSALVKSAKWMRFIHYAKLHPAQMDTSTLRGLAGDYDGHLVIYNGGHLYYTFNGYKTRISAFSPSAFTIDAPLDNRMLEFEKDKAGKIYRLVLKFNNEDVMTYKRENY